MPSIDHLEELTRAVFPRDRALAEELAVECGKSFEELRLVERSAPPRTIEPPTPGPPAPPPRAFPPVALMLDSIVHAAEEAMASDGDVRSVLRAAFARARGLGLTVEEVDDALTPTRLAGAETTKAPERHSTDTLGSKTARRR
jgi:hypothetical protein